LLAGASAAALLAVPMGVMAPGTARAADVTIGTNQSGGVTLINNTTISNGVGVTSDFGIPVTNNGGFTLTNLGTVFGDGGVYNLNQPGTVNNSGTIISIRGGPPADPSGVWRLDSQHRLCGFNGR